MVKKQNNTKSKACFIETTRSVSPSHTQFSFSHSIQIQIYNSEQKQRLHPLEQIVPPDVSKSKACLHINYSGLQALQTSLDSLHNVEGNTCPSSAHHHLRPCPQTWRSLRQGSVSPLPASCVRAKKKEKVHPV